MNGGPGKGDVPEDVFGGRVEVEEVGTGVERVGIPDHQDV